MLTGKLEQAAAIACLGIPEACANGLVRPLTSHAGGLGGSTPTQRGVWGAEPARIHAAMWPQRGRNTPITNKTGARHDSRDDARSHRRYLRYAHPPDDRRGISGELA